MLARFRSVSSFLFCCFIVGMAVILNWPVEYDNITVRTIGSLANRYVESSNISVGTTPAKIVMGGWPFTYYIANRFEYGPPAVHIAWGRLAGNVIACATVVLFFWMYERRANRNKTPSGTGQAVNADTASDAVVTKTNSSKRRFSVSDLVLLVTLVALCIGYWQGLRYYVNRQDQLLRQRAGAGMQARLAVQLPSWIERQISGAARERFLRVREIELDQPDDESLSFALSLDTLRSLHIGGGTYDLKLLERLRKLPLLTDLRVSGRQLNAEAIAAIASCKQLQSLNLMRTNITAEGVRALGEMPKLQFLNLIHTDVWLHELGRPAIANNLSTLLLPHRDHGLAEELILEDWNELVTLQIAEYDTLSNAQPLTVTLRRLPKLNRLSLDKFQTFALTLDDVPNLQGIYPVAYQATERTRKRDLRSEAISLQSLKIRNSAVPAAAEINASNLHVLDIQSDRPVSLRFSPQFPNEEISQSVLNPQARHNQKLLDQLGQCSARPMRLDLSPLDLREVDLGPFAKITGLKSLAMSYPTIAGDLANVLRLSVQELDLRGAIKAEAVAEIVTGMPNLERLTTGWQTFDRVSIEQRRIREIRFASNVEQRNQVLLRSNRPGKPSPSAIAHLVDLPNLTTEATYLEPLSQVRVENVPALTHLRFFCPLPPGSIIRGLRNLECFAGGGKELGDEHFDAIALCKRLKTLCLLYSNVSSNKLKEIGGFEQLTCLSVSGSKVTDEVLASWTNQKHLRTLRLKQTMVTLEGIKLIPRLFPRLERLTIDTPVDATTLKELLECELLIDLGLQGSTFSAAAIQRIQTLPNLKQLDLSGCSLDANEALALIQTYSRDSSKHLLLTNARLMQADPKDPAVRLANSLTAPFNAKMPQQFRIRMLSESQTPVRFFPMKNMQIHDIWLDQYEVWDELFKNPADN